jgi:hypothetical protein
MKTTIDMAREAGIEFQHIIGILGKETISTMGSQRLELIEQLVALVRADEREEFQRWFDAVTAQHKQLILAEREACAKVADLVASEIDDTNGTATYIAAAIRARGKP